MRGNREREMVVVSVAPALDAAARAAADTAEAAGGAPASPTLRGAPSGGGAAAAAPPPPPAPRASPRAAASPLLGWAALEKMREPREHARDEPSAAAHEGNRRLGALVGEDRKRMWAKLTPRFIEQQVSPYCVGPQGSPSSAARRGWGQPPSPQPILVPVRPRWSRR